MGAALDNKKSNSLKNPLFVLLALLTVISIFFAYSNHFSNGFQFDDSHTIEENNSLKEVDIVKFFTDGSTYSTLATNQTYRPLSTLENAIDYAIAGELNPRVFHIHIFITFLITCALLFVFVKKLLNKSESSNNKPFWALAVAAVFGLLCANAETVNYIIQRSEIVSGLSILLGFIFFLSGGFWRKNHLYLIFPFMGFFSKEMALVFAPLLFLYFLVFEENADLLKFYKSSEFKKCLRSLLKTGPALLLTIGFYIFYSKMLPETFDPGGFNNYKYLITQPAVMMHYLATFFVPYNLSADTDWEVFESITDYRAILGIIAVLALAYVALRAARNENTKLFAFGILWFFISLLPTSSFIAFSEVLNDHRSFIPYMGLTIAFVFGIKYLLETFAPNYLNKKSSRITFAIAVTCFLTANAYGVYQRNKVWKDNLSLWRDVTIKSPDNGRGHMNYGLALMERGDYENAEIHFKKGLEKLPNYPTLQINLGILQHAKGNKIEAEDHFKKALSINQNLHTSWYFYGRFLFREWRFDEAISSYLKVLELSPNYKDTRLMLMKCYHNTEDWAKLLEVTDSVLRNNPNDTIAQRYKDIAINEKSMFSIVEDEITKSPTPEKYLDLSLKYFKSRKFKKCILAAEKALELRPEYAEAFNNIGIAHFYLKNYQKSIDAYNAALNHKPDYTLAQNNLIKARKAFQNTGSNVKLTAEQKANELIDMSLLYYNRGDYLKCIEMAKKSITIFPKATAFNNICSAYNELENYEQAIIACNEALKMKPDYSLAKGNLKYALKKKTNN